MFLHGVYWRIFVWQHVDPMSIAASAPWEKRYGRCFTVIKNKEKEDAWNVFLLHRCIFVSVAENVVDLLRGTWWLPIWKDPAQCSSEHKKAHCAFICRESTSAQNLPPNQQELHCRKLFRLSPMTADSQIWSAVGMQGLRLRKKTTWLQPPSWLILFKVQKTSAKHSRSWHHPRLRRRLSELGLQSHFGYSSERLDNREMGQYHL